MIGEPGLRLMAGSAVALVLGVALSALAGLPLLPGYLLAWLFLAAIPLGALPLLMIQAITGGRWIEAAGPPLRAALGTLPLLAVAFVPVLIFQARIYPWAGSGPPVGHALESGWLSPSFFTLRSVVYLAAWLVLARIFMAPPAERDLASRRRWAPPGLILHALLATFAAVDWSMSLEPDWHSTGYGMLIIAKQLSIGLAFACLCAGRTGADPERCRDLGAMLLAVVIVWLYLVFMSFLVSWSADLPHEVAWYQRRGGGWLTLLAIAILLHFVVPFFVLVSRAKRRPRVLAMMGALVLVGAFADYAWLVLPAFRRDGLALSIQDALAALALVGPWLLLFARRDRRPAPVEAAHGHA